MSPFASDHPYREAHEALYTARSGYAPKAEQERVAGLVRRLVNRYGGLAVRAGDTRMTGHEAASRTRTPPAAPTEPEAEQLGLPAA